MISSDDEYRALQADKRREKRREMREKKLKAKELSVNADKCLSEYTLHLSDVQDESTASYISKTTTELVKIIRDMQAQIDEDFRFKQYLFQMLENKGNPARTTIAFDDILSKVISEKLQKRLFPDDEQHS